VYLYRYKNSNKKVNNLNIEGFYNENELNNNENEKTQNVNTEYLENIINTDLFIDCNNIDKNIYRIPTYNNPMMNIDIYDYDDGKQALYSYDNLCVKDKVDTKWNQGLWKGPNDIWNRRNSQREFYTTASTTNPNYEIELGKWLYLTPPTCKEGNGIQCAANLHNRLNRHMGDTPASNK